MACSLNFGDIPGFLLRVNNDLRNFNLGVVQGTTPSHPFEVRCASQQWLQDVQGTALVYGCNTHPHWAINGE
jgi:hypothetical protein